MTADSQQTRFYCGVLLVQSSLAWLSPASTGTASHKQAASSLLIACDKITMQGGEIIMSENVQVTDASDLCLRSAEVKEFSPSPSELQIQPGCYCCTYNIYMKVAEAV